LGDTAASREEAGVEMSERLWNKGRVLNCRKPQHEKEGIEMKRL